jgi:hypothetical protein
MHKGKEMREQKNTEIRGQERPQPLAPKFREEENLCVVLLDILDNKM